MKSTNKLIKGNTVVARDRDDVNVLLRKFKRKIMESKVLEEARKREYYEKPTTVRKKAKAAAKSRLQKKLSSEKLSPNRR